MKLYKSILTITKLYNKKKPNAGLFEKCIRIITKSGTESMEKTLNKLYKYERIECPNCGKVQKAKVSAGIPFEVRIHECISCDYIIMESEWDNV